MTQEDKELLIKDLCARLPYSGVQIHVSYEDGFEYDKTLTYEDVKNYCQLPACSTTIVKQYLRPLSSMTDEEREELKKLMNCDYVTDDSLEYTVGGQVDYDEFLVYYEESSDLIDWFNRKMFDYRGLIEKGLALEAKDGMYNN